MESSNFNPNKNANGGGKITVYSFSRELRFPTITHLSTLELVMAEREDLFENIPLDSSAVADLVEDGKIVEGTKTSVITNTLIEFANESHEDFFLNSKDNFGK